jgi:predicted adenylyl cyclase CyaB
MPLEIEAKWPLRDPRALRRALRRAGARFEHKDAHSNITLDTNRGELRRSGRLLRVRLLAGKSECHVAYKGPRLPGRAKRREEINLEAARPRDVLALFARLGFRPAWVYEGTREHYRLGRALVTIDHMAKLGWYCEVEAPSEREVLRVARRLGLPESEMSAKSYRDLAEERFGRRGRRLPDLRR